MKIKRILWSLILGIYLASDILSHLWYINWNVAEAATSWNSTNQLVAIIIDNETYNSIGSNWNFTRYTDTYIPENYPWSEAIIFAIDLNEYKAPDIVKLLENVYFDGIKNAWSRLIWVIVMWKTPLPVVKYENYIFPSIYPYTDFIDQKYIWDEQQWYYTLNKSIWEAEIRHWLISLDDASKYNDFFEKLKKYEDNPEKFIQKKIWYDDFIALNKNFLQETYQLYKNKIIFAEDLIYHRYTNFLVDMLQINQQNENAEILWDLQKALSDINVSIPVVETAKDTLLNNQTEFTPTLLLQEKINQFIKDYHEAIGTPLLKAVDDNIKASDRWTVNDSHYQKIQLKDQLLLWNEEANWIFRSVNDKLEQYVDDKINKEKYAMKLTIPIYYQKWRDTTKRFLWKKKTVPDYKDTYEFYYFWQNASTIQSAEEFSIFRWTFRNLDHFVNYSTIINDSHNPAKSKEDKTNLKNKWIWASYDLFSTQVEGNRWFNILNMETEYDIYNQEKRYWKLDEECAKYWFGISFFWCQRREWVNNEDRGECVQWSTDPDEIWGCETFQDFGNRVRWWATPLNLDMDKYQEQKYEFKWPYNYLNAIKPIFDIAWSVKLKSAHPKATSFEASTTYISPIKMSDKWGSLLFTDNHTEYTNAWYFNLSKELIEWRLPNRKTNFKKISSSQFSINVSPNNRKKEDELNFTYNIVPSIIKHDATTELQINGYKWEKYWTGTETHWYYTSMKRTLESAEDEWYSSPILSSMSNIRVEIAKLNTKIWDTPSFIKSGEDTIGNISWINSLSSDLLNTRMNIWTLSVNQMENWRLFNDLFSNHYWAILSSYIESYHQHQIDLDSPIDMYSKQYNEILSKIEEVIKFLDSKRPTAKSIFDNYNWLFEATETVSWTVASKIKELDTLIDEYTARIDEINEQIEGAEALIWQYEIFNEQWAYNTEIEELNKKIETLTTEKEKIETNLKTIEKKISDTEKELSWYIELNTTWAYDTEIENLNKILTGLTGEKENELKKLEDLNVQYEKTEEALSWYIEINVPWAFNSQIEEQNNLIEELTIERDEKQKILDEVTSIKEARLALQWKIPELDSKIENSLNYIEECTANHWTLWEVLNKNPNIDQVHDGTDSDKCVSEKEDTDTQREWEWDQEDTIETLINELKQAKEDFKKRFKPDYNNPIIKIPWMNILTQDRPIDSPKYVSFQWIWGNEIKLIYPDIFKVEVYNDAWGKLKLKKTNKSKDKNEIYKSLKTYFANKVDEYNKILKKEYDNTTLMEKYKSHYDWLWTVDKLATPTKNKTFRPYWEFTYNEMIKSIWWDEMLYTLAELLYYQSVSNNIREYYDNIWEDIDETRQTFDINKKINYIMEEYLKEDNDKIYRWEKIPWKDNNWERKSYAWLVIPSYSTGWYEVWYINSNWADNISPDIDDIDIALKWGISSTRSLTADEIWNIWYDDEPWDDEASQDVKKDCWYDPNEALSLFDWSWFKWLECWLKAVAKKPLTVKVYFQTSPTISSITEPLEQTREDYKSKFKTTIDWYSDTPTSDENLNERTHSILTNTQVTWNDSKVSVTGRTWSLNFLSLKDVWNIIVKIQSTWDNCLIINWSNTCWSPVTITKNPYKDWFSVDYKLWKTTIWNVFTSISLCSSADNCWVRHMSMAVVPWPISKFKIETTTDNKVIGGTYSLINIIALDSLNNEISRSLEKYYVKVNKWKLFFNWLWDTKQEISEFYNTTMLYKTEKWTSWTATVTVEDKNWKVMWKNTITIYPWDLKLNDKDTEKIEYQVSDEKYYNDDWSINTKKAIPVKLALKYWGQIVKITSNIAIESKNNLAKIMIAEETKDKEWNKKIKLRQVSSMMIENWEKTIYVIPWYKAGKDEITITVPWLDPKKIDVTIKPGEMKNIGIKLENDSIYPKDTIKWEIELTDARWNKIENPATISVKSTTEKEVSPSENPNINKGSRKFTLATTENDVWIHKITAKSNDWKISASQKFTVKNFFLNWAIESGLNIMYLNLFGNDRWNQWWYDSDYKKFAENIIQKSSKTLAVTTQLIAPSKIRETAIVFWKNWNIQNRWWLKLKWTLDNNKFKIAIDNVWDFTINDNFEKIIAVKSDVTNERLENAIKNEKWKVAYLFDINEDYTYEWWIFITKWWDKFAEIQKWIDFELSNYNLGLLPIWDISYSWKPLWSAIITNINYSKVEAKIEGIWYELWDIFDRWSTTSKVKALVSTINTLNDTYQWYDSIQNSDELEKYIWFRADFKNITLFAEWESVWESTIPFGSEFLINIWDPLLKNRDEVASKRWLWQVKFSEPSKSIFKVTDIDYNWDWLRDLIVTYRDWSIKLLKQYNNNKFEDLWTLMISSEQIEEVFVWDVDWNRYEDIIIKNWKNQMRVYTNEDWVFDVDWNIVCLNTSTKLGEYSSKPEDLSWVIQLFVEDMDNDWRSDFVTLDKKWYLKIVYWNWTKSRHSFLSKDVYDCDKNRYQRQEWSTKIIKKFGVKLASNGISDDSILRRNSLLYPWNDELGKQVINWKLDPNIQQTDLEKQWIYIPESEIEKRKSWNIDEEDIWKIVNYTNQIDTTEQAQKASEAASIYVKNPFVWKYMDILNDSELAFISMYNTEKYNSLTNTKKVNKPTKTFRDKNWGDLDDWDEVEVTVSITTNWVKLSEYFDKITWPRTIERDPETWAPKDLKFITWTWKIIQWTAWYDFGIVNIGWSSWIAGWGALQFKYTLKYHLQDPIYRIKIVREKPLSSIRVSKAEDEDITILRWNWLKYEEKNKDIIIKNPFGTQFNINDGIDNWDQGYINIKDIWEYIDRTSSKEVYVMDKNYKDLNGWELENWDIVEVKVTIPLAKSHVNINAILEDIKGPWNESWLPKSFKFIKGNGTLKNWINWYDFNITNIQPVKNWDEYIFEYTYNLTYKETVNKQTDNLPSIIVQPVDWCVKKEEVLKNNKQDKNRAYDSELVDLQKFADEYAKDATQKNEEANKKVQNEIANAKSIWTEDSEILNSVKEKFTVEDMLKDVWGKVLENNWLDFWNIDIDITKIMWVDLKKMENNIQQFANSLCHWFQFWTEWWSKTCEWLPVPFNQAFFAPGNYHIMWCIPLEPLTQTLWKWFPLFDFPWTLPTPFWPIPIPLWQKSWGPDELLRLPWGTYPSRLRIYAAPTLTAQLWIAICAGVQKVWMALPSPVSDIWGNCIVTAVAIPCPSWGWSWWWDDDWNWEWDETYENRVWEYWSTNLCKPQEKESPFTMVASSTLNSTTYPSSPSEWPYLWWLINIDYDPITSYNDRYDDWDSWIEINWVMIKWVKDLNNKILWWIQQWIQKILVDWMDRQVQYWLNNLLRFEIQFTFPDISAIWEEINKIWSSNVNNITNPEAKNHNKEKEEATKAAKTNNQVKKRMENQLKRVEKADITKDDIRKLNLAEWANPFKELQDLFNNSDLVNVTTQRIPIRIPWIYSEDIEAYKNYLLTWYEDNSTILKWWEATIEAAVANCNKSDKTDPEKAAHCKLVEDAQAKIKKLSNKFDKIAPQIFENVQTLEAYKRFPLQIYEWLHVTDKYLWDISALIWNFFWYINFWMDVNANRFSQYCDAIITIVTIVKTYQIMIDLFVDWWSKCWKCTQDTYDQYSCKLSFLCNAFEIPVIPIPSVKIPSLYIDFSNLDLQMNILLPRFTFKPESIELPRIPNLPQPPQLGIELNIDFDIPDIPQLPQPPELPELPSFIPQVKMELPILPPAPEIPEIPNKITWLLNVAKTLSKIFCIIKSWIGLVWESATKARIEQMTQRSYEVPRVDNLDLTMYFKQPPLQGIDIEVDSYVNLQYNFDAFYALLKSIVDPINEATYSLLQEAGNKVDYLDKTTSDFSQQIDRVTNQNILFKAEISKTNTPDKMKEQLYELRDSLTNVQEKQKVDSVIAYASTNTKVEKNEKGIKKIEDELNKLIEWEKENVYNLAELAKNDYDGFLNSIKDRKEEEPYQLTFATNLLNKNEEAEKAIANTNATDMLIETENIKVEWYYNALKNHTASELNMTEETYENSIKYMASIKNKINQRNSIKKNEYEWTTTLIDNEWNNVSKTLLTATNSTPSKNTASTNDYSQYVKWIYIKDWDKTINAVNSEYNYKKFLGYYEKDLDKDWKNELIMWDNFNLFVKYFEKWNTKGKKATVVKPSLKEGSKKQYLSLWWLFASDIKVYDENAEVKNFELKWQNYESLSFSWDNNKYEATSWYLMRIVERIDWFRENNSSSKIRYILFLPNWMDEELDNLSININWTTPKIKTLLWNKIYEVKYYNPSLDKLQFSLPEVPRKWEYVQITTIKLNKNTYEQNAPWSNQLVWWRQVIWDWEPPKATVQLERIRKSNEVIDEWLDLEWYVGTYYNIRITWYDETKVRETKLIEEDPENNTWKVLNEKDFDNFKWVVLIPNLFFTKKEKKVYTIIAVDSQGNETEERIELDIQVPGISIENIVRSEWYKDGIKGPVSILSELETDIDKWDVTFERFRNNWTTPITATEWWSSQQTYPVTTNQTKVTGQYYDYWDAIGLYTKDNKQIANINWANWGIELKWEYEWKVKPRVDLSQWYPTVKLMEWDNPLFEIIIQPEELIKTEVYKWTIVKLEGGNYWAFEWGSVIMKDNKPLLYIWPTGVLYTTENLQWEYIFNKSDETITYKIYEAFWDEVASITFKAKPLE